MQEKKTSQWLVFFLLPLLLLAYACEEEDAEPEELHPIIGKWYASGDNVATIFRTPPLNIDSIYMNIGTITDRQNRLVIEEHNTQGNIWYFVAANPDFENINNYAIYDYDELAENLYIIDVPARDFSNHGASRTKVEGGSSTNNEPITIFGIFEVNTVADPYILTMEYYYKSWPVERDELLDGFGQTQYGKHGIHHFTKIEPEEETL